MQIIELINILVEYFRSSDQIRSTAMNIIVNGGTRGIGKEIVIYLARNGNNNILVTGRDKKALKSLSARYKNIDVIAIDLSYIDTQTEAIKELSNYKLSMEK